MIRIEHLYLSPGHNYFGHHGQAAGEHPMVEVAEVECVAGRGLRGDRFFDYKPDYKGQITFFSGELYDELCAMFLPLAGAHPAPSAFRRNVITRGVDLNALIGREFEVQGVRFLGCAECSPCYWMDQAFAPGAEAALKGRGGLRAKILSDGKLRVDVVTTEPDPCSRRRVARRDVERISEVNDQGILGEYFAGSDPLKGADRSPRCDPLDCMVPAESVNR